MDFYKIIHDEIALKNFIDWLPELEINEKFLVSLFARKKYCKDLIKSSDKTQLRRFTTDKKRMIDKIKQLELPFGNWKIKDQIAPQESLVLYVMPNPRCMKRATKMLGKKCWDLMENQGFNPHTESLSCIQKSKSRTVFVDFDIDDKDIDLSHLDEIFPQNNSFGAYHILESRGGYHILVNPQLAKKARLECIDKKSTNRWHQEILSTYNVDCGGDQFIPVPGCIQGGFIPRLMNI